MKTRNVLVCVIFVLPGCAHIDFGKQGLTYYEPKPYLFVTTNKDCLTTATILSIPGEKKNLEFKRGHGSSELSVTLTNGMISTAGQKSDSKIPETITSITGLAAAIGAMGEPGTPARQVICKPSANLYPLDNQGAPKLENGINFPVAMQASQQNE